MIESFPSFCLRSFKSGMHIQFENGFLPCQDRHQRHILPGNSKAVCLAALVDLDEKSAGIKKQVRYVSKLDPIPKSLK